MIISNYLHVQNGMYFKTTFDVKSRAGEKISSGSQKKGEYIEGQSKPIELKKDSYYLITSINIWNDVAF